jgi:ABC-type antimicrobial peptide transport system permease subunit
VAGTNVAVVNQSLVRGLLGGHNAIGLRFRRTAPRGAEANPGASEEPWLTIVGVVADSRRARDPRILQPQVYVPRLPATSHPVRVALHVPNTSAAAVAADLANVATRVDPMLRVTDVRMLDDLRREANRLSGIGAQAVAGLLLSVLLLAAAGIYALMSFTVTRRRREIGIRAALGANTRRIISGVLARAVAQIAAGAGVGVGIALLLDWWSRGELMDGNAPLALSVVGAIVGAVGLLAAMGPARAALRVQPTEVLRGD